MANDSAISGALIESRVQRENEKGDASCRDLFTNSSPRRTEKNRRACEVLRFLVRVFHRFGSVPGGKLGRRQSRSHGASRWARRSPTKAVAPMPWGSICGYVREGARPMLQRSLECAVEAVAMEKNGREGSAGQRPRRSLQLPLPTSLPECHAPSWACPRSSRSQWQPLSALLTGAKGTAATALLAAGVFGAEPAPRSRAHA